MRQLKDSFEDRIERVALNTHAHTDRRIADELVGRYRKHMNQDPTRLNRWRIIMRNKSVRYATAAIVLILTGLTIHYLGGSPAGTSITFAQVLDQIQTVRPYAYTDTTYYHDRDHISELRRKVFSPTKRREEFPDGIIRIFDYSQNPVGTLTLDQDTKRAVWKTYLNQEATTINQDILQELRSFEVEPERHQVEDRGLKVINKRKTKCFHVPDEQVQTTVWVDLDTKLPVRIEKHMPTRNMTMIMTDFDFDPHFDASQFDRTPPEGYTLTEQSVGEQTRSQTTTGTHPSVAYTQTVRKKDGSETMRKMKILNASCRREEWPDGRVHIYQATKREIRMLTLDEQDKRAQFMMTANTKSQNINPDLFAYVRGFIKNPERFGVVDRGLQILAGQSVYCLHVATDVANVWTVWIDPKTQSPIRVELEHPRQGQTIIMTDIDFNPKFSQSEFDPNHIPVGYTLEKTQKGVVPTLPASPATEKDLIEGLRCLAGLLGGHFPKSLHFLPDIKQQLRDYVVENNIDVNSLPIGQLQTKTIVFDMFVKRLTDAPDYFDVHYTGDGVKLGDSDTVILWYRPLDTTNYHVIYGDLTVKETTPEDLPE